MWTIVLAVLVVGLAMAAMAVGLMIRGKCIRGTCGGEPVIGPDGKPVQCETCPNKDEHHPA